MIRHLDGSDTHTGLVGGEGFVGLPLALGVHQGPQLVVCQLGGEALRMHKARFQLAVR